MINTRITRSSDEIVGCEIEEVALATISFFPGCHDEDYQNLDASFEAVAPRVRSS